MSENSISLKLEEFGSIFFIGIGGVSMSSLAMIAHSGGCRVAGSDRTQSKVTDELEKSGINVCYGHCADNVEGFDTVVYTAAVREDNPELARARQLGIKVMKRAEFLGALMKRYDNRIGVAGTHGKSTVTSMLAMIYLGADRDPTVLSGAEIGDMGGSYRMGGKRDFIFEACEYADSFLSFYPTVAVVTNVEYDHSDYFKTFDQMVASFDKYVSFAEKAVFNFDCEKSREIAKRYEGSCLSWAFDNEEADYLIKNIQAGPGMQSFDLVKDGEVACKIELTVPGRHNVADAAAAAVTALNDGISPEAIAEALRNFHGAKRRFDYRGKLNGAPVYDDYAHHPSEIHAVIGAAREVTKENGRVICVFQPHTYTRTEQFFDGFVSSLSEADKVVLAEIYAAREVNTTGISSEKLANKIDGAVYLDSFEKIAEYLAKECRAEDTLIIVGAGDIVSLGGMLPLSCE